VAGNDKEWSTLLPIAMLVHNNVANSITELAPNQLLIRQEPPPTPAQGEGSDNPLVKQRVRKLIERQIMATQAFNRVAQKHAPDIPCWTKGLAQCKEPHTAIWIDKTGAQKTWTFYYRRGAVTGGLLLMTSPSVEHSPHFPCLTSYALHQNHGTW
jgi:hypothetical protein